MPAKHHVHLRRRRQQRDAARQSQLRAHGAAHQPRLWPELCQRHRATRSRIGYVRGAEHFLRDGFRSYHFIPNRRELALMTSCARRSPFLTAMLRHAALFREKGGREGKVFWEEGGGAITIPIFIPTLPVHSSSCCSLTWHPSFGTADGLGGPLNIRHRCYRRTFFFFFFDSWSSDRHLSMHHSSRRTIRGFVLTSLPPYILPFIPITPPKSRHRPSRHARNLIQPRTRQKLGRNGCR